VITWRRELHFTCDNIVYEPKCHKELILDQMNAWTKRGMQAIGRKAGWTEEGELCFCPYCSKVRKEAKGKRNCLSCHWEPDWNKKPFLCRLVNSPQDGVHLRKYDNPGEVTGESGPITNCISWKPKKTG
jgi:hypothetical protein